MSGQTRGQRPQGGHGSHDTNEDIKKTLEETIKAAQKALGDLSVKDGGKQKKPAPKRKPNHRGSKSMMDLSSADNTLGKSHKPSRNTNTSTAEYRNSPLLPNPPQLMGINPQFINPMWNAGGRSFVNMNAQYGPYYGNFPPSVSHVGNSPPPSYNSVPSQYNVAPQPHGSFGQGPPPPPPPSYEDTVKNDQQVKQKISKPKLSADNLVKTLVLFNGQFGTAEMLARQIQVTPEDVIKCAKLRKDLFALMGEGKDSIIELVPKVSLCTSYISADGCEDRQSCVKLHICKSYVTDTCKLPSCQYGHRWDTTHNSTILSKLYLDLINPNTLYHVIRKVCKITCKLQVCNNFNSERGCKTGDNCRFMHICKSYVSGQGKCSVKGCSFNHNLASQQCNKLIKSSGLPANANRQEILERLLSSLEKEEASSTVNKSKNEDRKANENIAGNKKNDKARAKCDSSSYGSSDSESSDDTQDKGNQKKKQRSCKNRNKVVTVKSSDVSGDSEIPEICLYAIDNACRNTKNGCKYLHAKSLFQWQAEKNGKWYNLRVFQSKTLENAYRDVSKGTVHVPALDESKLEDKAKELLNILGNTSWKADFQSMTMTCKGVQLKLRRVSTQSSVLSSSPKATVYEWYFEDEKGKWIQYGEVDSLGNQYLVCSVSSDDIEKQYLSNPSSTILISSAHYKYKLDFSKMTQMNLDTKKEREIRRRPSRLSYQKKKASEHDPNAAIPSHWNQMVENQTHLLVPLDPKSQEYQEAASRLRLTLPTANIQKIQRLQNPYLWRLFQYKKAQLSQRYDELQLNVQKLFHGINVQSIDTICKENFDWRQGIAVQQKYGQGTYFSNSAATARGHCTPDSFGRITMFLAQVIIGMVAKGDSSLTRPPSNPSTNALYDTTVDDITAPTVFVKYDKEEYYPEYVIEYY